MDFGEKLRELYLGDVLLSIGMKNYCIVHIKHKWLTFLDTRNMKSYIYKTNRYIYKKQDIHTD